MKMVQNHNPRESLWSQRKKQRILETEIRAEFQFGARKKFHFGPNPQYLEGQNLFGMNHAIQMTRMKKKTNLTEHKRKEKKTKKKVILILSSKEKQPTNHVTDHAKPRHDEQHSHSLLPSVEFFFSFSCEIGLLMWRLMSLPFSRVELAFGVGNILFGIQRETVNESNYFVGSQNK